MRKFVITLLLFAAISASAQVAYNIKGQWNGQAGQSVYLMKAVAKDSVAAIDSAKVAADFSFALNGTIPFIDRLYVGCGSKDKEGVLIDGTPLTTTIETVTTTLKNGKTRTYNKIKVAGKREQAVLEEGDKLATTLAFFQLGKMMTVSKALETNDSAAIDSAKYKVEMIDSLTNMAIRQYMDSTKDDIASVFFFDRYLIRNLEIAEVEQYFNALSPRVKQSHPGMALQQQIESLRAVNIGGIAPNIELPTPDGSTFSLRSLRGKVVLLDFWASWCGPCLAELPNVKKLYEAYHSKGLEILGVSLDEKHENWTNMIQKKGMPWHHVSSLMGWKCPVAALYNVTGIPRMYIIDPEGKIIAQDLRGEELAAKMKEIFGE